MDAYQWLEDVTGEAQLAWVRQRNEATMTAFDGHRDFEQLRDDLQRVYDADDRIAYVSLHGGFLYNFWRDTTHPHGLWRRTTPESYRSDAPVWDTVLDLDALCVAEGENWVWHGAEILKPSCTRALVALSRGGADADVTREFDLEAMAFVAGGFDRPEAKGHLAWIDHDTVFLVQAEGEDTVNTAGYSRFVKQWRRGTALDEARVVFEGPADNNGYGLHPDHDHVTRRSALLHFLDSRDTALFIRQPGEGAFTKVDAPDSAAKEVHRGSIAFELRQDWEIDGATYPTGALLVADLGQWLGGDRSSLRMVFEPTASSSLVGVTFTQHHLVLTILDDVATSVLVLTQTDDGWAAEPLAGLPRFGTIGVAAVDADASDDLWVTSTNYLTPPTLLLGSAAQGAPAPTVLKSQPVAFDASGHVAEQHFATSLDGTRVPYFLVRPADMPTDGTTPTLMHGYGGFEIPMLPGYSAAVGKGWLERGGAYVVANIRGGSEYGPRWHQAALRNNRHKAYEDFAAVAADLAAHGVADAAHLAMMGRSNGGLLAGNMVTQFPELFGAIVIGVPLLDMQRYHQLLAGASWMAEYGDPDLPEEWEFIRTFSPYHLFDADRNYPPTLIFTSTRDDRVHPGHARKFMAKMEDAGKEVAYFENVEGGHGGAADSSQQATLDALYLTFLWRQASAQR